MKPISEYTHAYFLGIGGIGMSAICRYLHEIGLTVAGYDKTETPLTRELAAMGIKITYEEGTQHFPTWMEPELDHTLCIITPAIPSNHPQWNWLQNQNVPIFKRAEILGIISQNKTCLAVAGTHGKTTTSTLLAHILKELNFNFSAFLGGISSNFGSNYIRNRVEETRVEPEIIVVEADEFDRSFHQLHPSAAIITAIDADHLDIYETEAAFKQAFEIFASQVKPSIQPHLFLSQSLQWPTAAGNNTYGEDTETTYRITRIDIKEGHYYFQLQFKDQIHNYKAGLPGYHNVWNAAAAIALCHGFLNIPFESLLKPIENFKGVRRRFEYLIQSEDLVVIDDYAHHPTELNMIITSVKDLYPQKKVMGVFQPHLFSRTRDFAHEFAKALDHLDIVYLLDIYPAREEPIPGITSEYLKGLMQHPGVTVIKQETLLNELKGQKPEVLLLLGAGDIDRLRQPIMDIYG